MPAQPSLAERMRAVRRKHPATDTKLPERLLESVRQSLKVEGYDVSIQKVREVAQQFEVEEVTP